MAIFQPPSQKVEVWSHQRRLMDGNTLKGLTELAHNFCPFRFHLVWNVGMMSGAPALLDYEATLRLVRRHQFSMASRKI